MIVNALNAGDRSVLASDAPAEVCLYEADSQCPLTPALQRLLQACVDFNSTDSDALAAALYLSKETVHSSFKRINNVLETHDRGGAVILALKLGWVTFSPDSAVDVDSTH